MSKLEDEEGDLLKFLVSFVLDMKRHHESEARECDSYLKRLSKAFNIEIIVEGGHVRIEPNKKPKETISNL